MPCTTRTGTWRPDRESARGRMHLVCTLVAAVAAAGGLTLEQYNNTQALGKPFVTTKVPHFAITGISGATPGSFRILGSWTPKTTAQYVFACDCMPEDHLFVWIDDHMMCDTRPWTGWQGKAVGPASIPLQAGRAVFVRAHLHHSVGSANSTVSLRVSLNSSSGVLNSIPQTQLTTSVPPLQERRLQMQRGLLQGWNSWWSTIGAIPGFRGGMLAVALLPESFALTVVLCQISTRKCLSEATVAGTLTHVTVRPGIKALDAS